jgi:diaminopropionate ammonia-lyase
MKSTDYHFTDTKNFNLVSDLYPDFVIRSSVDFHKTLPHYQPTPLIELPGLAEKLGVKEIYIKDEAKRFGLNAFKSLGASFAINEFLKNNKGEFTFSTATDGNHGRAVAWASKMFNQEAVVFVPSHTAEARINNIRNESAEVIVVNGDYDKTVEEAKEQSKKNNWILVQDSSWEGYTDSPLNIMKGYLTMFFELEEQLHNSNDPGIDLIFLQAGVGSWAASAAIYYCSMFGNKSPKLILVEPFEADCVLESVKKNRLTASTKSQRTIMAGLNCGTPSLIAFDILKHGIDLFISIPDKYSEEAMKQFYFPENNDVQIISGESGAAGLAGLLALLFEPDFKNVKARIGLNKDSGVLIFNTEGDTDPVNFSKIIF